MIKYIIAAVAVVFIIFILPRIVMAKYAGATIRIFNETFKGVLVSYIGRIVSVRKQKNIIKYPNVNSLFLCKPSGKPDAEEKYYTYSKNKGRLYYIEKVNPGLEKTNTEEKSYFHEILIKPYDKLVLNWVFRMY